MSELQLVNAESLIECVPNISEGTSTEVVQEIVSSLTASGVRVLHVDSGVDAQRTVLTFVGSAQEVEDASYRLCQLALERIDMSIQSGAHPRLGAVDVCPFVPLHNSTMNDCVEIAQRVGRRVGEELQVPVYLYGAAASSDHRRSLAEIRKGEYEGLPKKLEDPRWQPDFGPALRHERFGALTIGARPILIAFNVSLGSQDLRVAKKIAAGVRKRSEHVRAIGWNMPAYGCTQISMNLLSYKEFGLAEAYKACEAEAAKFGVNELRGSEVIGMLPLRALEEAGKAMMPNAPADQLIEAAISTLGLALHAPFLPKERVLELAL